MGDLALPLVSNAVVQWHGLGGDTILPSHSSQPAACLRLGSGVTRAGELALPLACCSTVELILEVGVVGEQPLGHECGEPTCLSSFPWWLRQERGGLIPFLIPHLLWQAEKLASGAHESWRTGHVFHQLQHLAKQTLHLAWAAG